MVFYMPGRVEPQPGRSADLTPKADRRGTGPLHRRPGPGQARRGHRPAQPHAPAEALAGDGRRGAAQEHPDDRAHRRGQDRDRPTSGPAGRLAVHQGRGVEVHRGGLRRTGRGVDGPRSGGDRHRHGPPGATRPGPRPGRGRPRSGACSICCCLRDPAPSGATRPDRGAGTRGAGILGAQPRDAEAPAGGRRAGGTRDRDRRPAVLPAPGCASSAPAGWKRWT